jgi:hypothetical protein
MLLQLEKHFFFYVGFEVFTAVVMESTIFWDTTPRSLLSVKTFRRNIYPPSSGSKNNLTCFHGGFLLSLFFGPEDGDDMFLRNVV